MTDNRSKEASKRMSANNKTERKLVENYLTQHDLEVTINEVVNFCVRERPRDPFEFMARAILEKSTTVKGVTGVSAYQVLDGNGVPCLEVVVKTERGEFRAQVPSDNELLDPWRRPIKTSKPAQDPAEASLEANQAQETDGDGGDAEAKASEGKDGSDQASFKKPAMPPYVQLRDGDENAFGGLGVLRAVDLVNGTVGPLLLGKDPVDQTAIDKILTSSDGTDNCGVLGSNAMLAMSLAMCRAGASEKKLPLCRHLASLAGHKQHVIPVPCFALLSGGNLAPAGVSAMAFEQIGIMPTGADNFAQAFSIGDSVRSALARVVEKRALAEVVKENRQQIVTCMDGTWCISKVTEIEALLELVMEALDLSGHRETVKLSITVNANAFYSETRNHYDLARFSSQKAQAASTDDTNDEAGVSSMTTNTAEEFLELYRTLLEKFPEIVSLEDPFSSTDTDASRMLNEEFGEVVQIAGDRVLRCHSELIAEAVAEQSFNAVVVKLTNVRTVSELVNICKEAQQDRLGVVLSTADSETSDDVLADVAVALQVGMIKAGSLLRAENVSKYNTLARLEAQLGKEAFFAAERFREPV